MKKYIALFLVLALLGLCACGGNSDTPNTSLSDQEKKDIATACIDQSVDVLLDKIGQPASSDYVPSCLDPDGGAEDGELSYGTFTVYTYRKGDTETVVDVE